MSSDIPFTKSLRFKLTLYYSVVSFLCMLIFVVILNIAINQIWKKDPEKMPQKVVTYEITQSDSIEFIPFNELPQNIKTGIREIRLRDLRNFQLLSLISLLPLAGMSFLLGYYISGRFLAPLNNLQKEFESPTLANLGKQVPVESDDEIGVLIATYNDMSMRLRKSFDAQTQFVQDASHELRTPLTVIKTNLDTIIQDDKASVAELRSAINKSLGGIDNMQKLSDNLLELTISTEYNLQPMNIVEIVQAQVNSLSSYAKDNKVELRFKSAKKQIVVPVLQIPFGRAVYNLLENGIKYSQGVKHAKVFAQIVENRDMVDISIHDNGMGIPEKYQQKIFERFYRVDKSRSRKTGGLGLGLSIVKKIVDDHKGQITLTSIPGNTVFTITLKKAQ